MAPWRGRVYCEINHHHQDANAPSVCPERKFPVFLGSPRKINPKKIALTRKKKKKKKKENTTHPPNTKKTQKKTQKKFPRLRAKKKQKKTHTKKSFSAYARKNNHLPGVAQMSKKRRNFFSASASSGRSRAATRVNARVARCAGCRVGLPPCVLLLQVLRR